jgi:hypothetical protein
MADHPFQALVQLAGQIRDGTLAWYGGALRNWPESVAEPAPIWELRLRELKAKALRSWAATGLPYKEVQARLDRLHKAAVAVLFWQRDAPDFGRAGDYLSEAINRLDAAALAVGELVGRPPAAADGEPVGSAPAASQARGVDPVGQGIALLLGTKKSIPEIAKEVGVTKGTMYRARRWFPFRELADKLGRLRARKKKGTARKGSKVNGRVETQATPEPSED